MKIRKRLFHAGLRSPELLRGLLIFATIAMVFVVLSVQPKAEPSASFALSNVEQRTVLSKQGSEYRVFVIKPKAPPPPGGYPVLYALDGNSTVGFFSNLAFSHMGRDELSGFVPGIVVAVGYPTDQMFDMRRRSMDYTPDKATPGTGTYLKPEQTGGAGVFLDFLEHELKPAIERDYKIDTGRQTLFGHSFGGLFTLHALFTRPRLFQNYVAASPSIWWAEFAILRSRDKFVAGNADLSGKRILITVGGLEQELAPHQAGAKDAEEISKRLKERRMVSEARELHKKLATLKARGLGVTFEEIANETHGSVIPYAAIKAFRFAFSLNGK